MPQFDVHRNPGVHRDLIPFVVVVQSRRLDGYSRRLVVPLLRGSALPDLDPGLAPRFRVEDTDVVLNPLELISVPRERLGPPIASLRADGDRIIAAIDMVISRAWG